MVSLGTGLKFGILAAVVIGIIAFRDQIKGALSSAGAAVGEGIGAAGGQFVTGIGRGFAEPVTQAFGAVPPSDPYAFFFSGPIGKQINPQATAAYSPGSIAQPQSEQVVNQYNRETSDSPIIVKSRTLRKDYEFPSVPSKTMSAMAKSENSKFWSARNAPSVSAAVGHANRVREQAAVAGTPTPKVLFEAVRQAALREGKSPGVALTLAREAIR